MNHWKVIISVALIVAGIARGLQWMVNNWKDEKQQAAAGLNV